MWADLIVKAYGWRSTMYFLAVFAAIMTILFLFFPDTWRREVGCNLLLGEAYPSALARVSESNLGRAQAFCESAGAC